MRTALRLVLVILGVVSALYFVFWVGGAILMAVGPGPRALRRHRELGLRCTPPLAA